MYRCVQTPLFLTYQVSYYCVCILSIQYWYQASCCNVIYCLSESSALECRTEQWYPSTFSAMSMHLSSLEPIPAFILEPLKQCLPTTVQLGIIRAQESRKEQWCQSACFPYRHTCPHFYSRCTWTSIMSAVGSLCYKKTHQGTGTDPHPISLWIYYYILLFESTLCTI